MTLPVGRTNKPAKHKSAILAAAQMDALTRWMADCLERDRDPRNTLVPDSTAKAILAVGSGRSRDSAPCPHLDGFYRLHDLLGHVRAMEPAVMAEAVRRVGRREWDAGTLRWYAKRAKRRVMK